jgi:hypothetical protein
MFNSGFDDIFFTSHYVNGLRDDIRNLVQPQLPDTMIGLACWLDYNSK